MRSRLHRAKLDERHDELRLRGGKFFAARGFAIGGFAALDPEPMQFTEARDGRRLWSRLREGLRKAPARVHRDRGRKLRRALGSALVACPSCAAASGRGGRRGRRRECSRREETLVGGGQRLQERLGGGRSCAPRALHRACQSRKTPGELAEGALQKQRVVKAGGHGPLRSEEHTSELQSQSNLVCR